MILSILTVAAGLCVAVVLWGLCESIGQVKEDVATLDTSVRNLLKKGYL